MKGKKLKSQISQEDLVNVEEWQKMKTKKRKGEKNEIVSKKEELEKI